QIEPEYRAIAEIALKPQRRLRRDAALAVDNANDGPDGVGKASASAFAERSRASNSRRKIRPGCTGFVVAKPQRESSIFLFGYPASAQRKTPPGGVRRGFQ